MADNDRPSSTESARGQEQRPAKPATPLLGTPLRMMVLGVLLWLLAGAAAAGAHLAWPAIADELAGWEARLGVAYALYTPATVLALLALATITVAAVRWGVHGRDAVGVPNREAMPQMIALLRLLNQRALVSETAKRIAYREQDLTVLRQKLAEDLKTGHFDAAMVLVQELGQTYGYREESEAFREQIGSARSAEQDAKISEALARLDEILARHDFDRAAREAAKIQRLFPESERVRDVMRRVRDARERYKLQLEREFLEAAERDDINRAMDVLKTMDKYLSEAEAAPLRETARGVIGKQRDNLGVRFKIAVHDKEWMAAVRVGEQIIREFPNTRMAEEVRAMIDLLRERAAGQQAVQG